MTKSQLHMLLTKFEAIMDASLFGFPSNIATNGMLRKKAEESAVSYNSLLDGFDTSLPMQPELGLLHGSREKEIDQLQQLCREVGLPVTAAYASTLVREIGRNEFEHETQAQFESLKLYLTSVADKLDRLIEEGRGGRYGGHTEKMQKLEVLLEDAVKPGVNLADQQDPVGIVFVERRITAITLYNYFCRKRKQYHSKAQLAQEDTQDWPISIQTKEMNKVARHQLNLVIPYDVTLLPGKQRRYSSILGVSTNLIHHSETSCMMSGCIRQNESEPL